METQTHSSRTREIFAAAIEALEPRRLFSSSYGLAGARGQLVDGSSANYYFNIARAADGSGVITWTAQAPRGNVNGELDIMAQRFLPNGGFYFSSFVVNTPDGADNLQSSVAVAADGSFVIDWYNSGTGGLDVQKFDNTAAPTSAVRHLTNIGLLNPGPLAINSEGNVLVLWEADNGAGGSNINGQLLVGDNLTLFAGTESYNSINSGNGSATEPAIAVDPSDNFIVAWRGPDAGEDDIFMRRTDDIGIPINSVTLVNTTTAGPQVRPRIGVESTGAYVVTWLDISGGVKFRRYNSAGQALDGEVDGSDTSDSSQGVPTISVNSDDKFLLAWNSFTGLHTREFNSDGTEAIAEGASGVDVGSDDPAVVLGNDDHATVFYSNPIAHFGTVFITTVAFGFDGTSGNDTITAHDDGNGDLIVADSGSTITASGEDQVVINGADGNDSITITSVPSDFAPITINGGNGNDTIVGSSAAESISGDDGTDSIDGGLGADTLSGGTGANILTYATRTNPLSITLDTAVSIGNGEAGENDTIDGTFEAVLGGSGNDIINASAMTTLVGLIGGNGNDTLIGGSGNDIFKGDAGADSIVGNGGSDTAYYGDRTANLMLAIDGLADSGQANEHDTISLDVENLTAGSGNDRLIGSAASNQLRGGDGNDLIKGGSGNDSLEGGDGNDSFFGGGGADTFAGGAGTDWVDYSSQSANLNIAIGGSGGTIGENDHLDLDIEGVIGGSGNDRITAINSPLGVTLDGKLGNDTIVGGSGNDILRGGIGNDSIEGGLGNDNIRGYDGNDTILGGGGRDLIFGDNGNDSIRGGDDADSIYGNDGNDFVNGDAGNDSILGGLGNDSLTGAAGNDTLLGGRGSDYLRGSDGNDLLDGGASADHIIGGTGTNTAARDVLDRRTQISILV